MALLESKNLTEYIRKMPKVELHVHLEGALSPELILKLADRNGLRMPFKNVDDFEKICRYKSFKDFSNVLLLGVSCLQNLDDFADAVKNLGLMLIKENICYAEVTWTPQFYLNRGFSLFAILEVMNEARIKLYQNNGLKINWIPDIVRSYPKNAFKIAEWASMRSVREAGVVALGLGGPEKGFYASSFKQIFMHARLAGLPANPHAGENAGADSVWDTIRSLNPVRIGHGVRSIEDNLLVEYLSNNKIPLEVCITSNIRLGIFPNFESHPIKNLIRAGCEVTLNTDDPTLFNTSLSQEYYIAIKKCGLSISDIENSILSGIHSSYLNVDEKKFMDSSFRDEFAKLKMLYSINSSFI